MPRGFERLIMGDEAYVHEVTMKKVRKTQQGAFDPGILCGDHDRLLGVYDNYAITIDRGVRDRDYTTTGDRFSIENVHCDTLTKFALAVLWRASISKRPEFDATRLGPYEQPIANVLFDNAPLTSIPGLALLVCRYTGPKTPEAGLLTVPAPARLSGVNTWAINAGLLRYTVKLDKRPLHSGFDPFVLNGRTTLLGLFVPFEGSSLHETVFEMAGRNIARRKATRPRHETRKT